MTKFQKMKNPDLVRECEIFFKIEQNSQGVPY